MFIVLAQNKLNSKVLKQILTSEKENKKYFVQDKRIREEFQNNKKHI